MNKQAKNPSLEETNLRKARLLLLQLHKLLIDFEREVFEREFGVQSSGQFLQLLLTDEKFDWLRVFSKLIVDIDEKLDLDDGISNEMIENYMAKIKEIVYLENAEEIFKQKYQNALQENIDVLGKHTELRNFMTS